MSNLKFWSTFSFLVYTISHIYFYGILSSKPVITCPPSSPLTSKYPQITSLLFAVYFLPLSNSGLSSSSKIKCTVHQIYLEFVTTPVSETRNEIIIMMSWTCLVLVWSNKNLILKICSQLLLLLIYKVLTQRHCIHSIPVPQQAKKFLLPNIFSRQASTLQILNTAELFVFLINLIKISLLIHQLL